MIGSYQIQKSTPCRSASVSAVATAGCAATAGTTPSARGAIASITAGMYFLTNTIRGLSTCPVSIQCSTITNVGGTSSLYQYSTTSCNPTGSTPAWACFRSTAVATALRPYMDGEVFIRSNCNSASYPSTATAARIGGRSLPSGKITGCTTAAATADGGDSYGGNASGNGPGIVLSVASPCCVIIRCERLRRLCEELVHKQTQRQNCCQKQRD